LVGTAGRATARSCFAKLGGNFTFGLRPVIGIAAAETILLGNEVRRRLNHAIAVLGAWPGRHGGGRRALGGRRLENLDVGSHGGDGRFRCGLLLAVVFFSGAGAAVAAAVVAGFFTVAALVAGVFTAVLVVAVVLVVLVAAGALLVVLFASVMIIPCC